MAGTDLGFKASEGQAGKKTFWVFNQSHEIAVPVIASVEPRGQVVTPARDAAVLEVSSEPRVEPTSAVQHNTSAEISASSQRQITDFFSPCSPSNHGSKTASGVSATPSFITPCPLVKLSEVPVVFQIQQECNLDDYLDPTHPLFESEVSRPSSELSSVGKPGKVDSRIEIAKRERRYSTPSLFATWHDRTVSSSSNDGAFLGSHARLSESCLAALPDLDRKVVPFDSRSSPPDIAPTDFPAEDDDAENNDVSVEKYWIEKDEERLAVIAGMEKAMAGIKEELANIVTAFQMATAANHRLQPMLEKKDSTISQMKENMDDLLYQLDVADMDGEKLKKDMAHSQRNGTTANPIQAKVEWESEKDFLEAQLIQRCESVALLTETLSRVADSDRWKDVKQELKNLETRSGNLPEEIKAALHECNKWKTQHDTILEEQQELLSQKDYLESELQYVQEHSLTRLRDLKQKCKDRTASEKALKKCLKNVFERMVRVSLCLETAGYLPFDDDHRAVCEPVLELTGEDYQEPLLAYYADHEIQDEFSFDDDLDEEFSYDEDVHDPSNGGKVGYEDNDLQGNDPEVTQGFSSALPPGTTIVDNMTSTATMEQEAQEFWEAQEARREHDIAHSHERQEVSPTAVDQAFPAVTSGLETAEDQPRFAFSTGWQSHSIFSTIPEPDSSTDRAFPTSGNPWNTSTPVEATITSSNAGNGHSRDICNGFSFATGEYNPFSANAESVQPAEAKTPNLTSPTEQGAIATEAPNNADPNLTKTAFSPPQLQDFDFSGSSSPVAFSSSSATSSPQVPKPTIFVFGGESTPSITIQPEEKKGEDEVANNVSRNGASKGKTKKDTRHHNPFPNKSESALQEANSQTSTSSPTMSRSQMKAAKKAKEKARKKAEMEARNKKARERKWVERVLMMGC